LINKIKNIANTEDKKRLFSNFVSLSVLQGANYILPLITLPYLVRVLGPEKFGLIAFAQAFIQYFVILTDYGFNLSATREISIYRENRQKVQEIFSSVMIIKLTLTIISIIILSIIVFSFEKFRNDWGIYFLTFGMVIGQVLFPVWFFQGMERMKYITFLNITAKLIFTISIFIFVHKASDYIYVPLLNSLGFIVAGIMALWIVFRDFSIDFRFPSLEALKHQLKEGWYIFISTVAISLYTVSNTFILGLFTNPTIVGYYAAYEKIHRAIIGLFYPIFQASYPYFSKLYIQHVEKFKKYYYLLLKSTLFLSVFIFIFVILFAKDIVIIILGSEYLTYLSSFYIMSMLIVIIPSAYIIFNIGLLSLGLSKYFMKIYIFGGLINILTIILLVGFFKLSIIGATISLIFTETIITITAFVILNRNLKRSGLNIG
jgi:PST family polysaccharide transporter